MGFLSPRSRSLSRYYTALNAPLLSLSSNQNDAWTLGDSFEHTLVFGGTGSGKTSATGAALATAFIRAGFGGLVLCAKPDEADRWEGYARACGRANYVVRVGVDGQFRFNFLDYLMGLPPAQGGGLVDNAVNTLLRILEAAQSSSGNGTGQNEGNDFWHKAIRELLSNAVGSLYHAYGHVSLDELLKLINSAPLSEEQARDAEFQASSFCYATMRRLFDGPEVPLSQREATLLVSYFGQTLGRLDAKTRSNIIITLTAEVSPFLKGPLHTLFCTETNFIPEITHQGVILILDLPLKRFEHMGVVAQMLVKYLWQKATERRLIAQDTRPVFLFADEAQLFVSPYDVEFQSTARSARAATVYITQNLPSLYARIGGRNPQDQADALIGNFQTKIFHANSDHRTNQWAADTIGKAMQRRHSANWSASESQQYSEGYNGNWSVQSGKSWGSNSGSTGSVSASDNGSASYSYGLSSGSQKGGSKSRSRGGGWNAGTSDGHSDSRGGGWSEQMDYLIQPADFASGLRQGGPRNDFVVSGILLQANRVFSRTGCCWTPVAFKQR